MSHDHDDPHDPVDAAVRMINRAKQRRGHGISGPDEGYEPQPQPRSTMGRRVLRVTGIAVVTMLAALVAESLRDDSRGGEQPIHPVMSTVAVHTERMYAQRDVRVYRAPSGDSAVVRRLRRGESVLLGEHDGRRWAKVYEPDGDPIGFVYVTDNFGQAPPPGDVSPSSSSRR